MGLDPGLLALAFGVALLAGVVKGVVGFAMPMVLISGLSGFISPEIALGALIFPTVVSNVWQALRNGLAAAWQTTRQFRVFLTVGGICLLISAQLVRVVGADTLLAVLGALVTVFAAMQLTGWQPRLRATPRVEATIGAAAGLIGGFSGVWGPLTVLYLTALDTDKASHMRIQGVIYGLGSVGLVSAHLGSGVLNAQTASLSAALVVPAGLGMVIGTRISDRIDQAAFRKATLIVLLVAGANLLRKGLMG
jgi:uncharacterized membrane protein YfcA